MRQYVIDELRPADFAALKTCLDERYAVEGFEGLYHLNVDALLLSDTQMTHHECGPFYFALELHPDRLVCELLVRARQCISCGCIRYATQEQREWLVRTVDALFEELGLIG